MTPGIRLGIACLLITTGLSCSKCQKPEVGQLTDMLPATSSAVLVLPDLAASIKDLNILLEKFSTGPAATFVNQARAEATRISKS